MKKYAIYGKGAIMTRKNVENEEEFVQKFVDEAEIEIIGDIPRDSAVQIYENQNQTVIQGDSSLPISKTFIEIAKKLI